MKSWSWRHKNIVLLLLLLGCLKQLAPTPTSSHETNTLAPYQAKVVGVTDGDTMTVRAADTTQIIRLYGVDCPEQRQPYGAAAKQFTSKWVFGKMVLVTPHDIDRYKRQVASITLPDGADLAALILEAGLAWWSRKYAKQRTDYAALEKQARQVKRGLWQDPNPVEPYRFRRFVN